MKSALLIAILFFSCIQHKNRDFNFLSSVDANSEDWTAYEGKWLTKDGVVRFELFLKNGSEGIDTYYKLGEFFERHDSILSTSTSSQGLYTTYRGRQDNEVGIRLLGLSSYNNNIYMRFKSSELPGPQDEMFFITRGDDELIPCDASFNPLTYDWHSTLHKRSKLFTIEGYLTIEGDSIDFFERNTREHWSMAELGEFNEVRAMHRNLVKQKYEGIYLKALAYTVRDTNSLKKNNGLVVKRILGFNQDPD
ncbi:MAG: hypothetical protein JNL53_17080 [Cyclobacteriaceae bacterium]|nr:hypothetical protein [Cyclobacteriaceae bacterium]